MHLPIDAADRRVRDVLSIDATDRRVWDVLCVGIAVGVVAWGAIGAWTAVTVETYPWNQWIPFANGAGKGAVLGLFSATFSLAVSANGFRTGWRWSVLGLAFLGGSLWGTHQDLRGAPASVVSFVEPLADERWFGTTMLLHWSGKVALPALVCATAVALLSARPYRRAQSIAASTTLLLAGIALLALPWIASDLAPAIQGNGEHTNQGIWPTLRCWTIGIPVLMAGFGRLAYIIATRHMDSSHPLTASTIR